MKPVVPNLQLKSPRALELTMRDVLESMQDAAGRFGFHPGLDNMQILSIEAVPEPGESTRSTPASVHQLELPETKRRVKATNRSSNILQFLFERETRLVAVPT